MRRRGRIKSHNQEETKGALPSRAPRSSFSSSSNPSFYNVLFLQRTIGNQAVQRLIQGAGIRVQGSGVRIQAKLKIGQPNDMYEQEADKVAKRVMSLPEPSSTHAVQREMSSEEKEEGIQSKPLIASISPLVRREPLSEEEEEPIQTKLSLQGAEEDASIKDINSLESRLSRTGGGTSLPNEALAFMQPRFGVDFSRVRVHTDGEAIQINRLLNAQASTYKHHIFFGAGKTSSNDGLTAHELTHVLQQTGGSVANRVRQRQSPGETRAGGRETPARGISDRHEVAAHVPTVQRIIEIRPPGRGEVSAFGRRQELIDRLNRQSPAIQYRLEGRRLLYNVVDEDALTNFDRQMRGFIDRAEVVPMRLITGAGYVRGAAGGYEPLLHDEWISGYVDLDDILASDDLGFQSQLVHIFTERFATRNYERRIGTATFTLAEFNRVHRAAYEAEAELFRAVIGDSTIRYLYSEERPNGTWVVAFRSNEGYRVFKVFRKAGQEVQGGEVWVQTRDGRRLTVEQLRSERAAAPAPSPAIP